MSTVVSTQRIKGTDICAALSEDGLVVGVQNAGDPPDMVAYLDRPTTLERWATLLTEAYQRGETPGHAIGILFGECGFGGVVAQVSASPLGTPIAE